MDIELDSGLRLCFRDCDETLDRKVAFFSITPPWARSMGLKSQSQSPRWKLKNGSCYIPSVKSNGLEFVQGPSHRRLITEECLNRSTRTSGAQACYPKKPIRRWGQGGARRVPASMAILCSSQSSTMSVHVLNWFNSIYNMWCRCTVRKKRRETVSTSPPLSNGSIQPDLVKNTQLASTANHFSQVPCLKILTQRLFIFTSFLASQHSHRFSGQPIRAM